MPNFNLQIGLSPMYGDFTVFYSLQGSLAVHSRQDVPSLNPYTTYSLQSSVHTVYFCSFVVYILLWFCSVGFFWLMRSITVLWVAHRQTCIWVDCLSPGWVYCHMPIDWCYDIKKMALYMVNCGRSFVTPGDLLYSDFYMRCLINGFFAPLSQKRGG